MKSYEKWIPALLFILSLAAFTVGLSGLQFQMIDTRFALFIHEMAEQGISPFPTLYGELYPDYTFFPTLMSLLAAQAFSGVINPFTAVLPTALLASAIVLLTYLIGKRMYSQNSGLIAAAFLFTAFEFVSIGRIVSIDLYPAFSAVLIFWCLFTADEEKKSLRTLWYFPLIILGFLARGPIGVIIPAAVMTAYCVTAGKWKRFFLFGILSVCIMIGLFALHAWSALVWGGPDFYKNFWIMQILDRTGSSKPIWYFFTNAVGSYAITYPLALFALLIFILKEKKQMFRYTENKTMHMIQAVALWMFLILLGMSIPGTKHLRYVTAMVPAAALLCAAIFEDPLRYRLFWCIRKLFNAILLLVPVIGIGALILGDRILNNPAVVEKIGFKCHFPLALPLTLLICAQIILIFLRKTPEQTRSVASVITLAIIFVLVRTAVVEPLEQASMPSHLFVREVENIRTANDVLHFFELGPDGDENKYMVHVDRVNNFKPKYVTTRDVAALPKNAMVIARKEKWEKILPKETRDLFEQKAEGKIGRRNCVLLIRK